MGKRQAVLESFQGDISPIQRGSTPLFNERIKVNMKTGLERIREKAKVDKHLKFSSLAHHINSNKIKEALLSKIASVITANLNQYIFSVLL